jgi:hypothetical protein
MKAARIALGLVIAFFVFGILGKAFAFVISAVGAAVLVGSDRAQNNLDAAANIVGFLGGLYVASRCYRWIAGIPRASATARPDGQQA